MSRVQPHDENEAQAVVLNVCLEDDITEGMVTKKEKGKKASVKELQARITELEVQLEIARPEHIEKMIESHRNTQLTIRDLKHFIDGTERAYTRLHARIAKVDGTQADLEELADLYQKCRNHLSPYNEQIEEHRDEDSERAEQLRSAQLHINDLTNLNSILQDENTSLREEKGELEDEISDLAAEITTLKTEKHDALTENQETLTHAKEAEQTQTDHNQSTPTETRDTHQETGRDHREPGTHYHDAEKADQEHGESHRDPRGTNQDTAAASRQLSEHVRDTQTRLSRNLESTTGDRAATRELTHAALNCISALKAAFTQEQQAHQETRERLRQEQTTRAHKELFQQQVDEIKRGIKKLPYTKMGSSDKLVALDYVDQVAARHLDIADLSQPFRPIMEQMAARLGLSEAQLTRINQTQKKAGAWTHDVKREFKERVGKKEIYTCTVTVSLDKILTDPEGIEKPEGPKGSHQGGARVRRCKDCNSDDMDRYALEYCRSCKKAHAQILPGLRSDANIRDAIDAIKQDRYTIQDHVFEYGQQDQDEQKHDAFTQEEVQELNAQLESTIHQIDTQLTMQTGSQPADMLPIEQKHDAFPEIQTEIKQKHDALTGQHTQDAEQSSLTESKMQGKVTIGESLHDAIDLTEGMRVDTPVGLATIRTVRYFESLEVPRWRCSVHTDAVQPNGSRFAAFDVCQVQPIRQVVLL